MDLSEDLVIGEYPDSSLLIGRTEGYMQYARLLMDLSSGMLRGRRPLVR